MSSIAKRIAASNPPPIVSSFTKRKNLYEVLNLLENNGIQQRVVPDKWLKKGIQDSYYVVDRVKLKQVGIMPPDPIFIFMLTDRTSNMVKRGV